MPADFLDLVKESAEALETNDRERLISVTDCLIKTYEAGELLALHVALKNYRILFRSGWRAYACELVQRLNQKTAFKPEDRADVQKELLRFAKMAHEVGDWETTIRAALLVDTPKYMTVGGALVKEGDPDAVNRRAEADYLLVSAVRQAPGDKRLELADLALKYFLSARFCDGQPTPEAAYALRLYRWLFEKKGQGDVPEEGWSDVLRSKQRRDTWVSERNKTKREETLGRYQEAQRRAEQIQSVQIFLARCFLGCHLK